MKRRDVLLKDNERKALLTLKNILSSKFTLLDFRLFGSKIRKEDSSESDIDVMIVLGEVNPPIESQIDDLIFKINLENDCFISSLIFSKEELEEGPLDESPIYKVIVKEGVRL
jgi:predicted nucleotidyltransferase